MIVGEYINKYPAYKNEIDSINTLFETFGMKVDEVVKGSQIIRYKLLLPIDLKAHDKIRKAERAINYTLPTLLNTDAFIYGRTTKYVYIEKKANEFIPVLFEDYITHLPAKGLYLLLGKDIDGHNMYTNLSKAPHILVAGATGSGKSELLHTFIASLISRRKNNPCQIYIIDPKIAEFSAYKNRKGITLITEASTAIEELKKACEVMEERYRELEKHGYKDISQAHDLDMNPIVFIIDELKDLLMQSRAAEHYIVRIAQKARGCGIHLIIGTQTPRKDVVTGAIKANILTKIALATSNKLESRIILDRNGAENLVGKGDMLYLGNGSLEVIRMQSAFVSTEQKKKIAAMLPYEEVKEVEPQPAYTIDFQRSFRITPDDHGVIYDDEPNVEYRMDGTKIIHSPVQQRPQSYTRRPGIIKSFINLMKVKPLMFTTSDYPPRI